MNMHARQSKRGRRFFMQPAMRAALGVVVLLTLLPMTGCNAPPIEAWQGEFEHYVQQQGQGNPNVLTRLSPSTTRRTFDHLGPETGMFGPKRTDTRGLLVGHRQYNDRLWFVFLVGVVQDQGGVVDVNFDYPIVQEIRPLAFARDVDAFHWAEGDANDRAMEQYLTDQRQRWARSHADREPTDKKYTRFPRPWDRFILKGRGAQIIIEHAQTGAAWSLTLPGETQVTEGEADQERTAAATQPDENS